MQDGTLTLSIRKGKRGGYICTLGTEDGQVDDTAVSQAGETMAWINAVFMERFSEPCYVPHVVYMTPQQQPQQQPSQHRPPDIPNVEPVDGFPNILNRPEDPSLESRIRNRGRVNGVAALALALCVSASLLGARVMGA